MTISRCYAALKRSSAHIDAEWWPVRHDFEPPVLEIAVGAVLTQNTSWRNAERALARMHEKKLTTARAIAHANVRTLQSAIRPAGFYRQKAMRVKTLATFLSEKRFMNVERDELLALNGIGHETADSVLLYALNARSFVIDAYTRRVFSRLGTIDGDETYDELKQLFERAVPKSADTYKEFHALIVEHAKATCRAVPRCERCVLRQDCRHAHAR